MINGGTNKINMDNTINLLITLTNGTELLRVALKVDANDGKDIMPYYLEPENKKRLEDFLPNHCKSGGFNIAEVQEIFEVIKVTPQSFSGISK